MQKSKKFVVLATYAVAVLCLLAGLFLPLFEGKSLLALQLPDVFKSLLNKNLGEGSKYAAIVYHVNFFGADKAVDFRALVIVLYAVVTALSLVALLPAILSVRKEGKLAIKLYYAVEIAAVTVLSLYLIIALQFYPDIAIHYNMIIALGGAFAALVVLCAMDKGKKGIVKIVLFLLSSIALLSLFNFVFILDKVNDFTKITEKIKLGSGLVDYGDGAGYLATLYTQKLSDILALQPDAKHKALLMLAALCATAVVVNYVIDTVRLGTGSGKPEKKTVKILNVVRYGLGFALAICVLATTLICKANVGIMLIILMAAVAIQLVIVLIRFILSVVKKPEAEKAVEDADEITIWKEPEPAKLTETVSSTAEEIAAEPSFENYEEEIDLTPPLDGVPEDGEIEEVVAAPEKEIAEEEIKDEPADEKPEEEEISPERFTGPLYTEPTENFKNEPVYVEPDVMPDDPTKDDTQYIENPEVVPEISVSPIPEGESSEEEKAEETVEEVLPENIPEEDDDDDEPIDEPVAEEPVTEEPDTDEPATEEPVAEKAEVDEPAKDVTEPYNPYMHRDNPFRAYENNSQSEPYNPYTQRKPANPFEKTYKAFEPKPAEPKPVEKQVEKPVEKPVQRTYKPYESATEKRNDVRPLQPRPIIQEFKPVPPVNEQPPKDPHIYTINTIYAGPMDDFIRKLSNDERIEFAKTFIEKNRGDLGNLPDYVVGGDNKKFFNVAFIYLGRIRGLVSDGLLNKMYKELNML